MKYISTILIENKIFPLVYSFFGGEEHVSWLAGKENEGMLHYLQSRKGDKRLRRVTKKEELYVGSIFYNNR